MTQKFFLNANDDARRQVLANLCEFLCELSPGKTWRVEVSVARKSRTARQNAALWACAYPPLMEFMGERGEAAKLRLHEYMCGEFFGWMTPVLGQSRPTRTTTRNARGERELVDRQTMNELYSMVQRVGAENGVVVPEPDPMYGLSADRWEAA